MMPVCMLSTSLSLSEIVLSKLDPVLVKQVLGHQPYADDHLWEAAVTGPYARGAPARSSAILWCSSFQPAPLQFFGHVNTRFDTVDSLLFTRYIRPGA